MKVLTIIGCIMKKMIVNAVEFARRFDLVRISENSSNETRVFTVLDTAPRYHAATFKWNFFVQYVDSPIGKIVCSQSYSCSMSAWSETVDSLPTFTVTNWVGYLSKNGKVLKNSRLYEHAYESYITDFDPLATRVNYTSATNFVLPKGVTHARVRFSAVQDLNIFEKVIKVPLP